MASFLLPSSIQKRLLRYALSRLEFLDSDVLDLENLDIKLGSRSVLEFRDVPLRLKKLAAVLQLPSTFDLTKARILLLRITIPVDIYSSPIAVEVDGVEAQLITLPGSSKHRDTKQKSRSDHDRKRDKLGNHRRRGSQRATADDDEPVLPSAKDLAASFLQQEPAEEKAELEAAIQSQYLEASVALSDDSEDEAMGMGAGLALPAFMANFLKGIVDRLQVRIRGIVFNLEVNLPSENGELPGSPLPQDTVTVQLSVDDIDIEGVTSGTESGANASGLSPGKAGKRLVGLKNLRGTLITDATFFASLARTSSSVSPSLSRSMHSENSEVKSKSWATRSQMTERSSIAAEQDVVPAIPSSEHESQLFGHASVYSSAAVSDTSRFDDAPESDEYADRGGEDFGELSKSNHSDHSLLDQSGFLDHLNQSQLLQEDDEHEHISVSRRFSSNYNPMHAGRSPLSTPRASVFLPTADALPESYFGGHINDPPVLRTQPLHSTILPERPSNRYSQHRISQSQPLAPLPSQNIMSDATPATKPHAPSLPSEESSRASSPNSALANQQDLAQSMIFSHFEAESMYMSALSVGDPVAKIPGAWDASSSEGSDSMARPTIAETHEAPVSVSTDNLEQAIHAAADGDTRIPRLNFRSSIATSSNADVVDRRTSVDSTTHASPSTGLPQFTQSNHSESSVSSDIPTKIAKQVFNLDKMAVYIPLLPDNSEEDDINPGGHQHNTFACSLDGGEHLAASTSPNVPGPSSMKVDRTKPTKPLRSDAEPRRLPPPTSSDKEKSVEVSVGEIHVQFDVSVGRLLFRLLAAVSQLFKTDKPAQHTKTGPVDGTRATASFHISVEQISLSFLERLVGTMIPGNRPDANVFQLPAPSDILLRAQLRKLNINTFISGAVTMTNITLHKFTFGYASENIVSFDAGMKIKDSVRDLAAPKGVDLSINIEQTPSATRIVVTTLPLHVAIDLQRLDETFSWFGGLSGVLNMGSSIASNVTIAGTSPTKPSPKPRSVRFDAPVKINDKSMSSQNKLDIRLGGLALDLVGKHCTISGDTSAIKIISREGVIGMGVDVVKITGPHLHGSDDKPAIHAEISSTRLEFLSTPQDSDLTRLLALITPSKVKYDDDDDILLDTLLRQRRQGSVLRLTIENFKTHISNPEQLSYLPELGEEVSRLATVAKYLPEDDRPGLLALIMVRDTDVQVDVNEVVGHLKLDIRGLEVAQITLPILVATSITSLTLHRNMTEELIGQATLVELREPGARSPAIMARMIGDMMDPKVKVKLWNLRAEYRVSTLMALLDLSENTTTDELVASMANSVATLTGRARSVTPAILPRTESRSSDANPMKIDVVLRDCVLGLNPRNLTSKILVVMTEAHLAAVVPKNNKLQASGELNKASILVIDDVTNIIPARSGPRPRRQSFDGGSSQVNDLCSMGFVSVSYISSAKVVVSVVDAEDGAGKCVDIELRDDLFVLESCADSTHTLVAALNDLKPPTPPSTAIKFRTKVIPVEDLLASLSGDAFGTAEGVYNIDDDFPDARSVTTDHTEDEENLEFDMDSHYYHDKTFDDSFEEHHGGDAPERSLLFDQVMSQDTSDGVILESISSVNEAFEVEELDFKEEHFGTGSILEGTAHRWDSKKNAYQRTNVQSVKKSPLKLCVRDVHVIWNLFDGYDWQHTRDTITKSVQAVQSTAIERQNRPTFEQDLDDDETVIGDFLFNSIYIGVPSNRDPRDLAMAINQELNLNDTATETDSTIAPSIVSGSTSRPSTPKVKGKRLRLNRSKQHKITFELKGVNVDLLGFPPGSGETQSSIDIRVRDFDIFDHMHTSTWRKFATYMHDAGERESGASQIHIEILNVKPMPDLAASEMVMKVTVLPLRLHVDQDALDFITRFFEFKDDSAPPGAASGDAPFLQRVEIMAIPVKLDFKPKRVDYAGLRSGHTTEFMNFIVLDEAKMTMNHTIIYGVSGFDKLGKCLNDIWMPDIKRNQLPGILSGLAPFRSLANVGGGVMDLVTVPIAEYKKDGRVVRSLVKGATAFTGKTGLEVIKALGKVAIGTQTALQGAERMLTSPKTNSGWTGEDMDDEEQKQISVYANQPIGVAQGFRGAYSNLARDLATARDAIIAIPGAATDSGSAGGVATAVATALPTIILRPMVGVASGVGQVMLGATNSLDPQNLRRNNDKYKKH